MRTIFKLAWTEQKLLLREPVGVFFTLVFPLLLLFLFGAIYGNVPSAFLGGRGNVDNSVPGYVALIIGTIGMIGLPINLATYRDRGILRRYRATPLPATAVLGAQIIVNLVQAFIGTILLLIVGVLVYDLALPAAPFSLLLALILSGFSFFAVGFLLASVLPTPNAAQAVGMALYFPMMFISGAGLPQEILPDSLVRFSQVLPLTHVVNLLKDIWYGNGWNGTAVLVLLGMMIVAGALSVRTFRWE